MIFLSSYPRMEIIVSYGRISFTEYGLPNPRKHEPPDVLRLEFGNPIIWSRGAQMCIPAGLFSILPTVEVAFGIRRLHRRRKRRKIGRCAKCHYDLRGLPEPRCPECGTPFDETAARPQRLIWVRCTGDPAVWGKAAALSGFAVLVAGTWYLLDGVASRVLYADWISWVSVKTGLSEIVAISVIIALILTSSFAWARFLYRRIAFRRVPDLRNADS
jgi:hypothetical protein